MDKFKLVLDVYNGDVEEYIDRPLNNNNKDFERYLNSAGYANHFKRLIDGCLGAVFSQDLSIDDKTLQFLNDKRVETGFKSVFEFSKFCFKQLLITGCIGVLCDLSKDSNINNKPYFAIYTKNNITDFSYSFSNGIKELNMVKLREFQTNFNPNTNQKETKEIYKTIYKRDNGIYYFEEEKKQNGSLVKIVEDTKIENNYNKIPFFVVSMNNNLLDDINPPFYSYASKVLEIYKRNLFLSGTMLITPFFVGISGVNKGDIDDKYIKLSALSILSFTDPNTKISMCETTGSTLQSGIEKLRMDFEELRMLGGDLVMDNDKGNVSTQTTLIRKSASMSQLIDLIAQFDIFLENLFQCAFSIEDFTNDDFKMELNANLTNKQLDPNMLKYLSDSVMQGLVPLEILYKTLKEYKFVDISFDEYKAGIDDLSI